MAIAVLGPTFEDLAMNVNKNMSSLSYIFVSRASGYIGGSLIGGILFDCVNPYLLSGKAHELHREKDNVLNERSCLIFNLVNDLLIKMCLIIIGVKDMDSG